MGTHSCENNYECKNKTSAVSVGSSITHVDARFVRVFFSPFCYGRDERNVWTHTPLGQAVLIAIRCVFVQGFPTTVK